MYTLFTFITQVHDISCHSSSTWKCGGRWCSMESVWAAAKLNTVLPARASQVIDTSSLKQISALLYDWQLEMTHFTHWKWFQSASTWELRIRRHFFPSKMYVSSSDCHWPWVTDNMRILPPLYRIVLISRNLYNQKCLLKPPKEIQVQLEFAPFFYMSFALFLSEFKIHLTNEAPPPYSFSSWLYILSGSVDNPIGNKPTLDV